MEQGGVLTLARPHMQCPKLVVPARNPNEGFLHGGLNSGTPTPMAFFSSLFADQDPCRGSKPRLDLSAEGLGSPAFTPMNFLSISSDSVDMGACDTADERPEGIELDVKRLTQNDSQTKSSGGYKALMPSRLPIASSPMHFMNTTGISPGSLLESPILLSMHQADPSPTTGALLLQNNALGRQPEMHGSKDEDTKGSNNSFMFRPHPLVAECGSPVNISMSISPMYVERTAEAQLGAYESEVLCCSQVSASDSRHELSSDVASGDMEPQNYFELETMVPLGKKPSGVSNPSNTRLSIDGYNWKKYGQKQLKNSKNPRSYYKCSHPFCPAKRQVEQSQEGEITEVMYKGHHNHAKPQGARRGARSGSLMVDDLQGAHHDTIDQNLVGLCKMDNVKACGDSSSSPVLAHGELPGSPEVSFLSQFNEDEYDEESIAREEVDDEHDSKRRRIEDEQEKPLKTVREPRVVVQTVSVVDILDDGYRWRKYGQKVVKGHYYPRNYYKCTHQGCAVKKHVERCSSDVKAVMTTYEGKHNHSVPAARGASRAADSGADSQSLASTYTDI